ncbi:hypothetical protein [Aeromicrobium wangtongii]|uniref:Uncharacterized protein n=1 Tax=Aeromicrobium wangtongii TaxID=2969247 RepID=A0ABY5M944_9ACTN|nr:hypothetical protein [Aeromicrobium wangtongii]MCD9199850.1 hypothetical protein [Aeromicrobium wangtongii]UUP13469.1 hypothetical protein NQV15_16710 [Aeromicrobium wangtongii]
MTALDLHGLATRGQLLRRADETIAASEAALFAARRALPVLAWSIGLLIISFALSGSDIESSSTGIAFLTDLVIVWWLVARLVPGRAFIGQLVAAVVFVVAGSILTPVVEELGDNASRRLFLATWGVLALGQVVSAWRYVATSRRLVRVVEAAISARREPAGRLLDDSDVVPEIATVHDLRDRADFDELVNGLTGRYTGRLYDLRVLKPTFILMVPGLLGLTFFLAPLVGADLGEWAALVSISGLLLLAPWLWASFADMSAVLLSRQGEANRVGVEAQLYGLRRQHAAGAAHIAPRRFSVIATPVGAVLAASWVALLVIRIRTASPLALVIAAAIVLVITAAVTIRVLRRRSHTRIFPLEGDGDSVLQSPARAVTLRLTDDGLEIDDIAGAAHSRTIPVTDILAIEPVSGTAAFAGTALGIVTTDVPVVLAGKDVEDEPAIVQLRRRLSSPGQGCRR